MRIFFAALLTAVIFFVAWNVGFAALTLFDQFRGGINDTPLAALLRELVVPAAAGALAIHLSCKWLSVAEPQSVFFLFSMIVVAVAAGSFVFMYPIKEHIDETATGLVFIFGTWICGIVGAYIAMRNNLGD